MFQSFHTIPYESFELARRIISDLNSNLIIIDNVKLDNEVISKIRER